jgi:hypothetical protein
MLGTVRVICCVTEVVTGLSLEQSFQCEVQKPNKRAVKKNPNLNLTHRFSGILRGVEWKIFTDVSK